MKRKAQNTISRALRRIFRTKTRSLLTMSGIAVGVFAVVIISGVGTVGKNEITAALAQMGINSALVETGSDVLLTDEDVACFAQLDGVSKAMPLMAAVTETKILNSSVDCLTWGVSEEAREIISLEALHGRLIEQRDIELQLKTAVIDEEIALQTYGRSNIVGKKISLYLNGRYDKYTVVGVAKSGISALQNMLSGVIPHFVYIPYTTMQEETGRDSFDKIALLFDENAAGNIAQSLTERINAIKNSGDALSISNLLSQKSQLEGLIETVTVVLSLIAAISLVVSGITVMTVMLVSVGERTREIGIKKSVGAKSFDILLEFLTESVLVTTLGSAAGIAVAQAVCFIGCLILGLGFEMNFSVMLAALGVSVISGIVFGVYPAAKAARLDPADALRM